MASYVALLRGIAPSNPKMRNAELVKVFEALGFEAIRPVISSGNVVFSTDERFATKLEDRIEEALHEHLGAPCSTIIRSRKQMLDVSQLDVFDAYDDGPDARCNVTFLKRKAASTDLPDTGPGSEVVAVHDRVVFSVIDTTSAKTPDLMAKLEKAYGREITTRTWKTVHRIVKAFDR